MTCPDCGTHVAPLLLLCPGCQRLVHADELKAHAAEAERLAGLGDLRGALAQWREALPLLPAGTRQTQAIATKVEDLVTKIDAGLSGPPQPASPTAPPVTGTSAATKGGIVAGVATVGLLLLKFKAIPLFLLTKGKVLLLGLTKWSTLGSMFISLSVYWAVFGWWFALGLIVSIYVHEMGHVVALRRFGIPASAPMFVPGLGAFVRMSSYPTTPREDARIGLAGPMWGLGANVVAYLLFLVTGWKGFVAIGGIGAVINLFNLTPVWQLDGARGWRALGRWHRGVVVMLLIGACVLVGEPLLLLVALVAAGRALFGEAAKDQGDSRAFLEFVVLIVALSGLAAYQVHMFGTSYVPSSTG